MINRFRPLHMKRIDNTLDPSGAIKKVREGRLSRNCQQILRFLQEKKGLHSANDIYHALRAESTQESPGLTTVYRSLETLIKADLVQEVVLGDNEKTFEFIEEGKHHHHVICTSCKESVHLPSCFVEQWETRIRDVHGFQVSGHILEMFGLCPKCQTHTN